MSRKQRKLRDTSIVDLLDDYGVLCMTPTSKMREIGDVRTKLLAEIEKEMNRDVDYDIN